MSKIPRNQVPEGRVETLLAWTLGGLGLLVTLGVLGVVIVDGQVSREPARVVATELDRRLTPDGVVVDVRLRNLGGRPAAEVEVEGVSEIDSSDRASAGTPYVAGRSRRDVVLVFSRDPGRPTLTVRGWSDP